MNRILCILTLLLSAQGISAQTNILKDWNVKYNAPLSPKKIKYYPGRDSLHVAYHPQVVVDTVSVFYDSVAIPSDPAKKIPQLKSFQRRINVNVTRSYKPGIVEEWSQIDTNKLKYYEITPARGLVPILRLTDLTRNRYHDSNIGSGRYTYELSPFSTDTLGWSIFYTVTDTTLSLREIKNTTVGALDPSNFYIGIFYTPSAGFRSITLDEPQFADLDALNDRHDAETNRYGHAVSLQLGYNYGRHTIYGEYLHLRQGFNSTNQTINWQTGMPAMAAGQRKYVFSSMGLGIGYNYSGYDHFVNTVIELGAYYNFFDVYYQDTTTFITEDVVKQYTNPMRAAGLRKNVFGLKAGLGLSLRPTFRWEIKLMPAIYYNLSPANNGVIETRLYNIGLTLGVGCRLGNKD